MKENRHTRLLEAWVPRTLGKILTKWPAQLGSSAALWRRYLRFCIVGGSGLAVDMAVLFLLASPATLGWNISVAKIVAAETAIINNFVWNDLWTFRWQLDRSWRALLSAVARFNLVCLAGVGWSVLLLNVGVHSLDLSVYLANSVAIILVSLWNFCLSERHVWRRAC